MSVRRWCAAGAHATAGGTLNMLQGGKFGHGFVAAGFTEALSPAVGQMEGKGFGAILARTAASAAIGGTASKLSGGKFANGAQTGAFQQLFNETVHEIAVQKMRDKVADIALSMEDDESYALDTAKGNFGSGAWKCNKFVFDVLNLAGISAPMMPGGKWPILANDWANTNFKIPGWIFVTDPQAGDVAGSVGHALLASSQPKILRQPKTAAR